MNHYHHQLVDQAIADKLALIEYQIPSGARYEVSHDDVQRAMSTSASHATPARKLVKWLFPVHVISRPKTAVRQTPRTPAETLME